MNVSTKKERLQIDESRLQRDVTGDVPSVSDLVQMRDGWRVSTVGNDDRLVLDATHNNGVILCRPSAAYPVGMPAHVLAMADGPEKDAEVLRARLQAGYDLVQDESLLSVGERGFLMLGGVIIGAVNLAWFERQEDARRDARTKREAERGGRPGATFERERRTDGNW